MKKAPVYLWTGPGWGKTTSALGVAMRCLGHGFKVIVIQFMKGRKDKIGEYRVKKLLGKKYEIHQFGRTGWVKLKKPSETDKKLAQKGLEFARKAAKKKPFLLILDEINLAVSAGLLNEKEVLDFLDEIPPKVHVYLTGRKATKKLISRANYVNVINMKKGPKRLTGEKGIDY
ncbi:cob(I)yrinic acid a,c-diamide adenosyltransferase [Candidatus Woesearchaeota archaeon]|nr:cob(I)yrinic acid a,c-diamide adenosyltransferase [Candidatus Woesearchaeota archaeon]